jgi:hypothetical protein
VLSALVFNLCLLLLPFAGAAAFFVISRDQLYAFELAPSGQRVVRARIEELAAQAIQLDFDRRQQWDDLVAMQLMSGDISAARGFLLSARTMLPPQEANQLDRRLRADASDADIELAALGLLTPGTRGRYEGLAPLLSRRSASGAGVRAEPAHFTLLGDQRDFEIMGRAVLQDSDSDPVQFTLTGLGLGLGGEISPRMAKGASAILAAARRQDYPIEFGAEMSALVGAALPLERFRSAALEIADGGDTGAYPNAAAAFRASLDARRLDALKAALDQVGAMAEATSPAGAALLLSHARNLRDIQRLRLIAQAGGDRAIAAARGAPHDGALPRAARGELRFTRDLLAFGSVALIAMLGLAGFVGNVIYRFGKDMLARFQDEDRDGSELVESFGGTWTPL